MAVMKCTKSISIRKSRIRRVSHHKPYVQVVLEGLDVLTECVETTSAPEQLPKKKELKYKQGYAFVNAILDDIMANTLDLASVKISYVNWTGRDELYDLGRIYKQQYKIEIQQMQE